MQLNGATPSSLSPSAHCAPAITLQDAKLIPSNLPFPFLHTPLPTHKPAHQTNAPEAAVQHLQE